MSRLPSSPIAASGAASLRSLSSQHIPALDGVRGIAVLLVMLFHYNASMSTLGLRIGALDWLRFGWSGVDVFFALSGFLITGILIDTKGRPGFFRNFYMRRVLRICPLYYGALLCVWGLQFAMPGDHVWGHKGGWFAPASLLWPATYLENVAFLLEGPESTGVMTHYWSLAVEEHFYLLWPLIVWLCSRRQIAVIAIAAILLSVVLRVVLWTGGLDTYFAFGLTPLRLDGLAVGALASLLLRAPITPTYLRRVAACVLAAAALALPGLVAISHSLLQTAPALWMFGYTFCALAAAAFILLVTSPGPLQRAVSIAPLRWFGRYSFGLYVWHPILSVILLHSGWALVASGSSAGAIMLATAAAFGLTMIVSLLSFHYWEQPFLALKRFFVAVPTTKNRSPEAITEEAETPSWIPVDHGRPGATAL